MNGADDDFRGRQLICFKSLDDPIRFRGDKERSFDLITMRFRDEARWPETMLMGVAYQSWFSPQVVPPITYPYFVARNRPAVLRGHRLRGRRPDRRRRRLRVGQHRSRR